MASKYYKLGFTYLPVNVRTNKPNRSCSSSGPIIVTGVTDCNIVSLNLPPYVGESKIEAIAEGAFCNCTNLSHVSMPKSLLKYFESFKGTPVFNVLFSRYKKYIKDFEIALEKDFPQYTSTFGEIFRNAPNLTEAYLPKSAKHLDLTFQGCKSLQKVIIPDGVERLLCTFQGCSSLMKIRIPATVNNALYALQYCQNLQEVIMEGEYKLGDILGIEQNLSLKRVVCLSPNPTIIGSAPNATLYVPRQSIKAYKDAFEEFDCSLQAESLPAVKFAQIKSLEEYDGEETLVLKDKSTSEECEAHCSQVNEINEVNDLKFLAQVRIALENYFESVHIANSLFYNEAQFQFDLAQWLKFAFPGIMVHLEYLVPGLHTYGEESEKHETNQHPKVDIVIERNARFVVIELKYLIAPVHYPFYAFAEKQNDKSLAGNVAPKRLYQIWTDVHRIEQCTNNYKKVLGGFAITLTNVKSIYQAQNPNTAFHEFALENRPEDHLPLGHKNKHYHGSETKTINGKTISKYPDIYLKMAYKPLVVSTCYAKNLLSEDEAELFKVFLFQIPSTEVG